MFYCYYYLILSLTWLSGQTKAQDHQKVAPAPNGSYAVGLNTFQVVNERASEIFAPSPEARALELSIFFPAAENNTVNVDYFPAETANLLDVEHSSPQFDLDTPNGTFEQLDMTIAANGTNIAPGRWPTLLFSGALGTTRLMYNSIASHISSYGYIVVTIDSPYDTDVVQFSNGTIDLGNSSVSETPENAILDINARSEDATFILDFLSDKNTVIPGCNDCLNLTHVGYFGHSIGGATAATVQLNESRIAGSVNYDGAVWGDVVQKGLEKPFMLFTNMTRASYNDITSWQTIWNNLRGLKFNMILANSSHYTFSDLPVIIKTLGLATSNESKLLEQVTDLDGDRSLNILVSYTVAFFDLVLKGMSSSLLQGPSDDFPEVILDNSANGTGTGQSEKSGSAGSFNVEEMLLFLTGAVIGIHVLSEL